MLQNKIKYAIGKSSNGRERNKIYSAKFEWHAAGQVITSNRIDKMYNVHELYLQVHL